MDETQEQSCPEGADGSVVDSVHDVRLGWEDWLDQSIDSAKA
jgi:hypothetical protein